MKFMKKHILSFEITICVLLLLVILISHFSYMSFFESFRSESMAIRTFDTIWLYLYWPNFLVYFYKGVGTLVNLLFYSILIFFPTFGLTHKRRRVRFVALHLFLFLLILIHFLSYNQFYETYRAMAGV